MKFVQELLYAKYMPSIIEYWYSYIKLDLVFFKLIYSKYTVKSVQISVEAAQKFGDYKHIIQNKTLKNNTSFFPYSTR